MFTHFIKAAFDSVDRGVLSKALQAKHVPPFLISLIKDLHSEIKLCVRVGRSCTFPTSSGVRQGCVLAPALFRIAIDWIVSICADKARVNVRQSLFTDTDYAADEDNKVFRENAGWSRSPRAQDSLFLTLGV